LTAGDSSFGEVYVGAQARGRGVSVSPGIFLTAHHVVMDAAPPDVMINVASGANIRVSRIDSDPALDLAALHLEQETLAAPVRDARAGMRWFVSPLAGTGLPALTGTITEVNRTWQNEGGSRQPVLQLNVEQQLGDFSGYSGSGVRENDGSGALLGILIEQQPRRDLASSHGAANVLYAVPISHAVEAFKLTGHQYSSAKAQLPAVMAYHDAVLASLRGYRSRLTNQELRFVESDERKSWQPNSLWTSLSSSSTNGCILLTGHGGVGKTRTALEVGNEALAHGWEVVHVRAGNASRVADELNALVSQLERPVLVIIDYLNLVRDLDLLSIADLAMTDRTEGARLSVLATSRNGWETRHRRDPGMDRFERIPLLRSDDEARAVCTAIVKQIAPETTAAFGTETVLDLTGSVRPILAVLLGQVIETQYVNTGQLPAALVSEDMAAWLESRLNEDEILPGESTGGSELPVRMTAAAVALSVAPAPKQELVRITEGVVGLGHHEVVAYTIDKLSKIGWLEETDEGLAPAHDVVVDKLLESAVFHHDTEIVRESSVEAMLGTARISAHAFSNVLAAIERVIDERTIRNVSSDALRQSAGNWIEGNASALPDVLSSDLAVCARVAVQILESEMWGIEREALWRDPVSEIVRKLSGGPHAAEPLQVACKTLARNVEPNVAAMAIDWMTGQAPKFSEFVLNACLDRKDVGTGIETLIDLALVSMRERATHVSADFTLARLLRRKELAADQLVLVEDYVRGWLELYQESVHAVHLLASVVARDDIAIDLAEAGYKASLAWVTARSRRIEGSYLLPTLARRCGSKREFEAAVWPVTSQWLTEHGDAVEAVYVLQALVDVDWLGLDERNVAWGAVRGWLTSHPRDGSTSFLLKALVKWKHLDAERLSDVRVAMGVWLESQRDAADADFVLRASIESGFASGEVAAELWPHVRRWLLRNSTLLNTRYMVISVLGWKDAPDGSDAVIWQCANAWMGSNGRSGAASHVLQSLLDWSHLTAERFDSVWNSAVAWTSEYLETAESSFVLQKLVVREALSVERAAAVSAFIDRWMTTYGGEEKAGHLLAACVGSESFESSEDRARRIDEVRMWLEIHAEAPTAARVFIAVLGLGRVTREQAHPMITQVSRWIEKNPAHRSLSSLLTIVMKSKYAAWAVPELWASFSHWLTERSDHSRSSRLLQSILRSSAIPPKSTAVVWEAASRWIDQRGEESGKIVLLIAESPRADSTALKATWPAIRRWFDEFCLEPEARVPLGALFGVSELTEENVAELQSWLTRWVMANPTRIEGVHLVRAALKPRRLSGEFFETTWSITSAWLSASKSTQSTNYLLRDIMVISDLSEAIVESVAAISLDWLEVFPADITTSHMVQELLAWPALPDHALPKVLDAAFRYVREEQDRPRLAFLFLALLGSPRYSGEGSDDLVSAATNWLTVNPNHHAADGVVLALVRAKSLTNRQVAQFSRSSRAWFEIVRLDSRRRRTFLEAIHAEDVAPARRKLVKPYVVFSPMRPGVYTQGR
jgi:hypothetical protein